MADDYKYNGETFTERLSNSDRIGTEEAEAIFKSIEDILKDFKNGLPYEHPHFNECIELLIILVKSNDLVKSYPTKVDEFIEYIFKSLKYVKGNTLNNVVHLLAELCGQQNLLIDLLLEKKINSFFSNIINSPFPQDVHMSILNGFKLIANRGKYYRDYILFSYPIKTLMFSALTCQSQERLEALIELAAIYTKDALNKDEVINSYKVFQIAMDHDVSSETRCKALFGILNLVRSPTPFIEYFDYFSKVLFYFGITDRMSELICYIIGTISSQPQIGINQEILDKLADLMETNSEKLITAASWAIGLICLNRQQLLRDLDNVDFIEKLSAIFEKCSSKTKEEVGFALVSLMKSIPSSSLLDFFSEEHQSIILSLFELQSPQTINLAIFNLKKCINIATFRHQREVFFAKLEDDGIVSVLEELLDRDDLKNLDQDICEILGQLNSEPEIKLNDTKHCK